MSINGKTTGLFRYILPVLAAGALIASAVPSTSVEADDEVSGKLPVYNISMGSDNPVSVLKEKVITDRAKNDPEINLDNVDIDRSVIDVSGINYNKSGIQTATVKVTLVNKDSATTDSVGYSFVETAAVNMTVDSAPKLQLRAGSVTVNNGDSFNPEAYIAYVNDNSGKLPVLQINSNVDTNTDGNYTVDYTAIDLQGNKTEQVLNVTVATPQEVLDQRAAEQAAAEAQAQAEADARQQAQQQAELDAQQQAQAQAASYAGSGAPVVGNGVDPYGGGAGNCTDEAWLLAYQAGHVLPNWGNAYSWLYNAQSTGYATGYSPAVGSIAVYSNHVAYVAAVNGDQVYIKEGNFDGHYNERWVSSTGTGTQSLQGYIYLN